MLKKVLIILAFYLPFYQTANAQPGSFDQSFNQPFRKYGDASGPDGNVRCILPLADGRVMLSGWFAFYNGAYIQRICRINSDGGLDNSFNPGSGANAVVNQMALQADGKIIAVGDFTQFNNMSVNRIIRLNADGSIDQNFNAGTGANGSIRSVAVQPDGKILLSGWFTTFNGSSKNYIVRLLNNGSIDNTFNPGSSANNYINAMILKPDGRILVAGGFDVFNSVSCKYIARLNNDGSLDNGMNTSTGLNGDVISMAVQADEKIVVGGYFNLYDSTSRARIARLDSSGSLDATFAPGTGLNGDVFTLNLQSDGKIIVGGSFTTYNNYTQNRLMRLNTDASIDFNFLTYNGINVGFGSTPPYVSAITVLADGKIFVGGEFNQYNSQNKRCLIKLNTNAQTDPNFIPANATNGKVYDIDRIADGKLYIAGDFSQYNNISGYNILRTNSDGQYDFSFNAGYGFNGVVRDVMIMPDGKLMAAGGFNVYNGSYSAKIARINDNGGFDSTFAIGNGANGDIFKMLQLSSNRVLAVGNFTTFNGSNFGRLVVLNSDGSVDNGFTYGSGANGLIKTAVLLANGKILLGGTFSSYSGNTIGNVVCINSDGTIDGNFNSSGVGFNGTVNTICVQPDGKVLVGGTFSTYNGNSYEKFIRLNSNGSIDNGFSVGAGVSSGVEDVVVQSDGKILIAGDFLYYNNILVNRITRLNDNGTFDYNFSTGGAANAIIRKLFVLPDLKTLIGGDFVRYGNSFSTGVARLNNERSISVPSFGAYLCRGSKINVPYYANGAFDTSNVFTVQLSDASGNFGAVTGIGSVKSSNSGIILSNIPNFVSPGNSYRIRVSSSNPQVAGSDNGINLGIDICNTVFITGISNSSFCQGEYLTVNYETNTTFNSGNTFTVQLSDTNGSFVNPTNIGSALATTNGNISALITAAAHPGSNYRMRIVSSSPATTSFDNNYNLIVKETPTATISSGTKTTFCLGDSTLLTSTGTAIHRYQWLNNGNVISYADTSANLYAKYGGSHTLKVTSVNGCQAVSNAIAISTVAQNQALFTSNNNQQCQTGNSFSFTDLSTATAISGRFWNFGDGNIKPNDSITGHSFVSDGIFSVKLTITYQNGCIDTFSRLVTVSPHPKAKIGIAADAQCFNGNAFQFYDSSIITTGFTNRMWHLTQTETSTIKNPVKSFTAIGSFDVKLRAISDFGCVDSAMQTVKVYPSPKATFLVNEANPCFLNNYFELTDTSSISSGTVDLIVWQIPGIGQSIAHKAGVSFSTLGNQPVQLVAISDKGCTDTLVKNILVRTHPVKPYISYGGTVLVSSYNSLYQWFLNDTSIGGAFFQTFKPLKTGSYKVRVDSSNGCSAFSDPLVVQKVGLAEATKAGNLKIYPNPAEHLLTIESGQNFEIQILDVTGKQVAQHSKTNFIKAIDVSTLPQGVYLLKMFDETGTVYHKFLKE